MGITGLGSLDLMLPSASASPVIVTRVFNDAGAAGTSGFNEEAVDPAERGVGQPRPDGHDARHPRRAGGSDAFPLQHRRPVARRRASASRSSCATRRACPSTCVQKSLDPNYFVQQSAGDFLGTTLEPNDSIEIRIDRGSVILYGATIDNITNDPSIQYARVVLPIALRRPRFTA